MIFNISLCLSFMIFFAMNVFFQIKYKLPINTFISFFIFVLFFLLGVAFAIPLPINTLKQLVIAFFSITSNIVIYFVITKTNITSFIINFIKKYHKILIAIFVILCIVVIGLYLVSIRDVFEGLEQYTDTNGATNYALQSISSDTILPENAGSTGIQNSTIINENKSGCLSFKLYDYDEVDFSCNEYNGTSIIQSTKVNSDEIIFTVDNTIQYGNCQICLVMDNEIIHAFDYNVKSEYCLKNAKGKEVFVMLAGEELNMKLSVSRR